MKLVVSPRLTIASDESNTRQTYPYNGTLISGSCMGNATPFERKGRFATCATVCEDTRFVFNATFNNISAISGRSVLLVEENGIPGENFRPFASH
jgi:hypothetical protein